MSTTLPLFDEPFVEAESPVEPALKIADEPIIADRSTLENYSTCPLMARLREEKFRSVDAVAISGEEAHKAISGAIKSYIDSHGALSRHDVIEAIQHNILASRSDMVVDTHSAMKYSAHAIGSYISDIHPRNILAFDGGEDTFVMDEVEDEETGMLKGVNRSLSGQLWCDLQFGRQVVRLTAEMDFLHATRSPGLLQLSDWKSGWREWTESQVAESFQFRFYAFLVFETFNQKTTDEAGRDVYEVDTLDIVIWNTRTGRKLKPARFERKDMEPIRSMILGAAGDFFQNRTKAISEAEARPTREGCRICSCAAACTVCDRDISEIRSNPGEAVDRLYALTRMVEEYEKTLKAEAIYAGEIVSPSGKAFGCKRVKRVTKPKFELYDSASDDDE